MCGQYGWVIRWAPVGVLNYVDRKDGLTRLVPMCVWKCSYEGNSNTNVRVEWEWEWAGETLMFRLFALDMDPMSPPLTHIVV